MKKSILLLLFMQLISIPIFAQEEDDNDYVHDTEICERLTRKGTRIYVEANTEATEIHTQNILDKWGYWTVTVKKKSADVIMRVKSKGGMSEYFAYAILIDNKTGKPFYRSPLVNTFGRVSFHGKKAVIKKVVRKIKNHIGADENDEL